jgi:formylmethanofuran dehydrogenase subunit C
MKEITLTPKEQPRAGLEAEVITPDVFAGKEIKDIKALEIFYGNRKGKLGDFFKVSGSKVDNAEDLRIVINGDVSRTKRIGEAMTAGEIIIRGNVDMYVGARMNGGKIIVEGNANSFAAQQMRGGELVVRGNCKDCLGSAYRGDWKGMKGGVITVEGDAGSEIGEFMSGGKIIVKGNAGAFAGVHMKGGLVVVEGNASGRVGAQMIGGNIVVKNTLDSLLPGFKFEAEEKNVKINEEEFKGTFLKYSGDHAEQNAKGVLYLAKV